MVEMDKKFLDNIDELLTDEGIHSNDKDDPGGDTWYGISRRSYPNISWPPSLEEAIGIYYNDWWIKYKYNNINDSELAGEVLEASVNMGPNRAHRLLQEAVIKSNGDYVKVDGILGPKTFIAINSHTVPSWLLAEYRLSLILYYLDLKKSKFLAGWIRRAIS